MSYQKFLNLKKVACSKLKAKQQQIIIFTLNNKGLSVIWKAWSYFLFKNKSYTCQYCLGWYVRQSDLEVLQLHTRRFHVDMSPREEHVTILFLVYRSCEMSISSIYTSQFSHFFAIVPRVQYESNYWRIRVVASFRRPRWSWLNDCTCKIRNGCLRRQGTFRRSPTNRTYYKLESGHWRKLPLTLNSIRAASQTKKKSKQIKRGILYNTRFYYYYYSDFMYLIDGYFAKGEKKHGSGNAI